MNDKEIISQQIRPGEWHAINIDRLLAEGETRLQKYRILELDLFGKCMELNSCIQSTEFDESHYHESLIFPAIAQHGNIRSILCFGGANGGIINKLMHVPTIEEVWQIDIDPEVCSLSKYYLPHLHPQTKIPFNLNQRFYDSPFNWAINNKELYKGHFNLIIADLPDATADSYVPALFTDQFYKAIKPMLSNTGIFVTQAGQVNPVNMNFHTRTISTLKRSFEYVANYSTFVPSYGTPWGFAVASDQINVGNVSLADLEKNCRILKVDQLDFYDLETHQYLFSQPKSIRRELSRSDVEIIQTDNLALVEVSHNIR
jgi:spermidine synthase